MYLTEPKLFDIVKKQFRFKMNAHAAAFTMLVFLQGVSLALEVSNNTFNHFHETMPSITWISFSSGQFLGLTLVWAFVLGILITNTARKNESFSFVTTRLSHHLANFLFMVFASVIGGITVVLCGSMLKLFAFFRYGEVAVQTPGLIAAPEDFFIRLVTAIALVSLLFFIGYTISALFQFSRILIVLLFLGWMTPVLQRFVDNGIDYIFNEPSFMLFVVKIVTTLFILFGISVASTNRLEVGQ